MMNSTGLDQTAVTVDLWLARTYNRHIGRLLDVAKKKKKSKEIVADVRGIGERKLIKQIVRDLAKKNNIDPSAMQAALWYFEQRLFRSHAIQSDSQNFSGAARTAAESRGVTIPGESADVQGTGETKTGQLQEVFQSQTDQARVTPNWYYSQLAV